MTNAEPWGMGSVLRHAGGSTGQTETGTHWAQTASILRARYRSADGKCDALDEMRAELLEARRDLREAQQLLNLITKREGVVAISNSEIVGYEFGASYSVESVVGHLLVTPKSPNA